MAPLSNLKGMHQQKQPSSSHVLPATLTCTALRVHTALLTLSTTAALVWFAGPPWLAKSPWGPPTGCDLPEARGFKTQSNCWMQEVHTRHGSGCSSSQADHVVNSVNMCACKGALCLLAGVQAVYVRLCGRCFGCPAQVFFLLLSLQAPVMRTSGRTWPCVPAVVAGLFAHHCAHHVDVLVRAVWLQLVMHP